MYLAGVKVGPDRGGNICDRHALLDEEKQPTPSSTPRRDGRCALPRLQRPTFRRREVDRESGFASTSHTDTSQTGEYGSCGSVPATTSVVVNGQGHHIHSEEE